MVVPCNAIDGKVIVARPKAASATRMWQYM
jgi:hypothetical protein